VGARAPELYRRSPYIVCYWQDRHLVFENYAARTVVAAAPLTCEILHFFDRWRPAAALARKFPHYSAKSIAYEIAGLASVGLLERLSAPPDPKIEALTAWDDWTPAATYFHLSTKDVHSHLEPEDSYRLLRQRARKHPMPLPVKSYPRNPQIRLPAPQTEGEFPRVLLERRTWRKFSRQSIKLNDLATLLGLTFGVQSWVDLHGIGRIALKTSPSGGSRHPIEAYVVAQRVKGLRRGLYHYHPGKHRLELLHEEVSVAKTRAFVNDQWWFSGAAAVVLMTAIFARPQWKYPAPRAYRVVLVDAGHLCQTFCLVATWLGLAPFCTMALADSKIENDLQIDGVTESIIYTAGVGRRAGDADAARWPLRSYGPRLPNRLA
jgi:SagB-type dehydrogenase family enzyme